MKIKKIILSIIYLVLCFIVTLSVSGYFSYKFVNTNEIVSAYIRKGSRVEYKFSNEDKDFVINESNNKNVREWIDGNELQYTKVYYESYYCNENKPIIIGDHPTKVLLSDSSKANYFDLDIVKGSLPNDDGFVVTEEIAEYYGISDVTFPTTISYDYVLNKTHKSSSIQINGIYRSESNKYVNKVDCYGNDCSKYTIVGTNSSNMSHFAAFIDIVEFLRSDKISNSFVLVKLMPMLGGIVEIKGYDSYSTYEEDLNFSLAIVEQRNVNVNQSLLIDLSTLWLVLGISSLVLMIGLSILLMKKYFSEAKYKFNTFHLCFLGLTISLLIILLVGSIKINGKILFIGSFFAGIVNLIAVNFIFALLLVCSIFVLGDDAKKLIRKDIKEYERNKDGLVSIIIPTYNGAAYLKYAIESALNQTYKNIEVIVVDDGTKDNGETDKIVEPYVKANKVKYFKKENGGVSTALNLGISKANGKFINWLSHDDMFTNDSIEQRLSFYLENPNEKHIVLSNSYFINENGEKIKRLSAKSRSVSNVSTLLKSTINGCTLLMPSTIFENHKFKEGMVFMQDYFLWAELLNDSYEFVYCPKKTVLSRIHTQQVSLKKSDLREKDFKVFYNEYIETLIDQKNYLELRKIMIVLQRRAKLHTFYNEYIQNIREFLKTEKHYDIWDKLELSVSKVVAYSVYKIRKVMKHE